MLTPLLTAREVARILGIATKTVHKLVLRGQLSCVQITGKKRRFTIKQLDEFVQSHTTGLIDKRPRKRLRSLTKGGMKSCEVVDRASLRKEMRSWQ